MRLDVLLRGLLRAGLGPAPGVVGPRPRHAQTRPRCTSGRSPGSAPAAPPPSPNFLPTSRPAPLGAPLGFPHELFSSARSNQRAPAPTPSPGWGRGELPAPPPRAPPSPARRRPAQSQPGPAPARPAPCRSLPPSRSVPALLPPSRPARSALGPAARAAPLRGGGETASGRPTPQLAGAGPRGPGGTPTPATSRSAPSRRSQCEDAPRPPARAAGTRGHTWVPPPLDGAGRARMGPR